MKVHCKAKKCDMFHLAGKRGSIRENRFLPDQCNAWKMAIADIEKDVTSMWTRATPRSDAIDRRAEIEKI